MANQTVFRRYELKYILTPAQKERLLGILSDHMALDRYGRTTIRNLYYDTDTYLLIRRSIEKPTYKEKLRVRSYDKAGPDSTVFVELKKKYKHVVYKRRLLLPEATATAWLNGQLPCPNDRQITQEVAYFLAHYENLRPVVFLSYEREAYYARDGSDFRITFDENILCRQEALSLGADVYGTPLLPDNQVLLELKCSGGLPLWLTHFLSAEGIYKTSFSKYGTAYRKMLASPQHRLQPAGDAAKNRTTEDFTYAANCI